MSWLWAECCKVLTSFLASSVYFELIGCDDLPNFDASTLNVYDKTDSFASIAFEDALVNTDVISDSLCPRWMPWCRRAFVFNVSHPSSDVLVALFDYDPESSPAQLLSRATGDDLHDRIGRVRINLAKFLPDTTYNLTYPLFLGGEFDKHRKKEHGRVHVRLRIECGDPRKVLLAGLLPPKPSYLAVSRKPDWEVAHFTVQGAFNRLDHFSMPRFLRYVETLINSFIHAYLVYAIQRTSRNNAFVHSSSSVCLSVGVKSRVSISPTLAPHKLSSFII